MPCAARLGDQVLHSQALPQAKSGWWHGLLKGALIGAAIVAVSAVAVVVTVGTGGLGAPFAIGAAAVIIGSGLRYAQVGFHEGAQAGALQGTRAGPIKTGSRNVAINGKAAALACLSLVSCTQHGDGQKVAQGSATVLINGHRMARVGDRGVCGFVIGEGSPNVFAGAPPASCHGLTVGSEIPQSLTDAVDTAGKVGAVMELLGGFVMGGPAILNAFKSVAGFASLGAVLGVGYEGSHLASDYAKRHGMSASDQMMFGDFGGLGASVVGGGALGLGARVFGGAPVVEAPIETPVETPVETAVEPPSLVDRSQLNPEDIFPGQQTGNNCAPQSCQQIVRVATGNNLSEADMAASAQASGGYDPNLGTPANRIPDILDANGVPASNIPNTPESIQGALDQGQGVVSAHNAEDLWPGDPNFVDDPNNPISGGHAVHTIDTVRDVDGNVTGYVINDTGTGTAGRVVPADQYEGSLINGAPATATNDPIYAPYQPAEAPPESFGGAGTGEGDTNAGMLGSGARNTTPNALLPGEGDVGTYSDLNDAGSRGDNLTPHHMPSNKYMTENGPPGYTRDDGISMNMEQPSPGTGGRHRSTASYGTDPNQAAYLDMSPRDAMARDIADARQIYKDQGLYTPEIRQSLQQVIQTNKTAWPGFFDK